MDETSKLRQNEKKKLSFYLHDFVSVVALRYLQQVPELKKNMNPVFGMGDSSFGGGTCLSRCM
jgi:hypothetical protein